MWPLLVCLALADPAAPAADVSRHDPVVVSFEPPKATGSVVVFGADRRDTIFILDCSISMADPMDPKNKAGGTRFQAARKALSDALRVLRDTPALGEQQHPYAGQSRQNS